MSGTGKPISPLLGQLPIVDSEGRPTQAFQRILASISGVIQNSGGILEIITSSSASAPTPTASSADNTQAESLNIQNLISQMGAIMDSVQQMQTAIQSITGPTEQSSDTQFLIPSPRGCVPCIVFDNGTRFSSGTGDPNNAVWGSVSDLFTRQDGSAGSTLYVKESGQNTDTGWVPK